MFSDVLLVCKKNSFQGKGKVYKLDAHIFLKEAMVDMPAGELSIKLVLPSGMYTLVFDEERERTTWRNHLQSTQASFH